MRRTASADYRGGNGYGKKKNFRNGVYIRIILKLTNGISSARVSMRACVRARIRGRLSGRNVVIKYYISTWITIEDCRAFVGLFCPCARGRVFLQRVKIPPECAPLSASRIILFITAATDSAIAKTTRAEKKNAAEPRWTGRVGEGLGEKNRLINYYYYYCRHLVVVSRAEHIDFASKPHIRYNNIGTRHMRTLIFNRPQTEDDHDIIITINTLPVRRAPRGFRRFFFFSKKIRISSCSACGRYHRYSLNGSPPVGSNTFLFLSCRRKTIFFFMSAAYAVRVPICN